MPEDPTEERLAAWRPRRFVAPGVAAMAVRPPNDGGPPVGGSAVNRSVGDGAAAGTVRVTPAAGDPGTEDGERRLPRLPGPGAFDPGRRGVRALAVVATVVVIVAALLAWRAQPRPEQVLSADPVPAGPSPSGPAVAAEPGASPSAVPSVVVAVAGKVRRPGLVRLASGARVADAIEASGGLLPGADVAFLNVARRVADGELILVGVTAPPGAVQPGPPAGGDPGPAVGDPRPAGGGAPTAPVNLNTASLAELDTLPGVGPVLAQRIVDHRERHGAFRAVDDLRQVDGIGETRFAQLRELVTV